MFPFVWAPMIIWRYGVDGRMLEVATIVNNGVVPHGLENRIPLAMMLSTVDLHAGTLAHGEIMVVLAEGEDLGICGTVACQRFWRRGSRDHHEGPVVWVNSDDGLDDHDQFLTPTSEQIPIGWIFTHPGDYKLTLSVNRLSRRERSGQAVTESWAFYSVFGYRSKRIMRF